MKKTINKVLILISIIFLASCGVNIGNNWVDVKSWDNSVKIWENWIDVKSWNNSVKIWENWVEVKAWEEWVNINSEEENTEEDDNISCEDSYDALFAKHWKNLSDCYFNKPDVTSCEKGNIDKPKINVTIILDDSGSMNAPMNWESMMEVAKDKVIDYIDEVWSDVNLSFILYGHKWDWTEDWKPASCIWIEEIYWAADNDLEGLKSKIKNLEANGWTPIADSLKKAASQIQLSSKQKTKNIILLISDGKETCWGDPIKEAKKIVSDMENTFIDVIWFNVEWDTQKQLMDIAVNWKWNYYDVKSRLDFENTFNKTKNFLDTMSCGASKAAIELSYWVEAINKYYSCMYRLNEEKVFMMVDAKEDCQEYFDKQLENRYNEYETKFKKILEAWETILDNFPLLIEEVEKQFEN